MLYANYNTTHTFNRSAAKSQKPSETKAKKNNKNQKPRVKWSQSQKPNGHANWLQTAANSTQIRDFGSKMQQIQARSQKPKEPEAKSQKPKAKSQKPEAKKKANKKNAKKIPLHIIIMIFIIIIYHYLVLSHYNCPNDNNEGAAWPRFWMDDCNKLGLSSSWWRKEGDTVTSERVGDPGDVIMWIKQQ